MGTSPKGKRPVSVVGRSLTAGSVKLGSYLVAQTTGIFGHEGDCRMCRRQRLEEQVAINAEGRAYIKGGHTRLKGWEKWELFF